MEIKERILRVAEELFRQYGIKSITMDDIARHLSVSKKTIYTRFPTKNDIVNEIIKVSMHRIIADMKVISAEAKDAVDEILDVLNYMDEIFTQLHPAFFYDLQKYHPAVWERFKKFQNNYLNKSLIDNLTRGIREGVYRKDVNIEIAAQLRMSQLTNIYNTSVFPPKRFNMREVHVQSITMYLYSIATLKGFRLIKHYQQHRERLSKKTKVSA